MHLQTLRQSRRPATSNPLMAHQPPEEADDANHVVFSTVEQTVAEIWQSWGIDTVDGVVAARRRTCGRTALIAVLMGIPLLTYFPPLLVARFGEYGVFVTDSQGGLHQIHLDKTVGYFKGGMFIIRCCLIGFGRSAP